MGNGAKGRAEMGRRARCEGLMGEGKVGRGGGEGRWGGEVGLGWAVALTLGRSIHLLSLS